MKTDPTRRYKTLFGPVLSRRLGISLGVDLLPHKTCSMDCIYCECGATTHLTVDRKEYVPVELVKEELTAFLRRQESIDFITFSGSGEPTLNVGIGEIIAFLKSNYPHINVALLTNSALFHRAEVRRQVRDVDVVMASLDAVTDTAFRKVNRPHAKLDLESIIDGIARFRKRYSGRLLIETFLVRDCNDSIEELGRMKTVLDRLNPHGVLLNTLDRPGTEPWVKPISPNRLKDISDFLGGAEIVKYGSPPPVSTGRHEDLLVRIVETVRRRPYTAKDVSQIMGRDIGAVQLVLDRLVASGRLAVKHLQRGTFYVATQAADQNDDIHKGTA